METNLRNATLQDLASLLQEQQARKVDVVVPACLLRSERGRLIVPGVDTELTDDGVTAISGALRPTDVCDGTLADKFNIPVKYLRGVRDSGLTVPNVTDELAENNEDDLPLIDAMLNAHFIADERKMLVRGFAAAGDDEGIVRAVLSDSFRAIDNLDSLMAVLDGVRRTGANVEVQKVDLSERAMRVHFIAPDLTAMAPLLLGGYRSPFAGTGHGQDFKDLGQGFVRDGGGNELPVVFAGFVASNSETGGGAFQVVPRIVVQACSNGLVFTKDALRQVHLGGKLDMGVVKWSESTLRTNIDLIAKQTADAVSTFLDIDYMTAKLEEIEAKAGTKITKPQEALEIVAKKLRYSQDEQETLLAHFISGGQSTAGGVLNAVTSMAQTVADPDRCAEIEASALDAFALVS